jgi:hypothetical protein
MRINITFLFEPPKETHPESVFGKMSYPLMCHTGIAYDHRPKSIQIRDCAERINEFLLSFAEELDAMEQEEN